MNRRTVLKLLGAIAAIPLIGWRREAAAAEHTSGPKPVIITKSLGKHRYRVVPAKWSKATGFVPAGRSFTVHNVYAPPEPPSGFVCQPIPNGMVAMVHGDRCFVPHTYSSRTW